MRRGLPAARPAGSVPTSPCPSTAAASSQAGGIVRRPGQSTSKAKGKVRTTSARTIMSGESNTG